MPASITAESTPMPLSSLLSNPMRHTFSHSSTDHYSLFLLIEEAYSSPVAGSNGIHPVIRSRT
ncbi:hypothetical protein BCEN4_570013 [Burkholderia cenocepacia]|nr:hypothetical protein BCEN4_570013 [Burkholderia cenocepacia]